MWSQTYKGYFISGWCGYSVAGAAPSALINVAFPHGGHCGKFKTVLGAKRAISKLL